MIGAHETGALGDIREFTMRHSEARAAGWQGWGSAADDLPVHIYFFGGILGGAIINERADFETLREFAACADETASLIWQQLQWEWEDRILDAGAAIDAEDAARGGL